MDLKSKLSTGLLRGEGGSPDPLVVKDYFFLTPSLRRISYQADSANTAMIEEAKEIFSLFDKVKI